MRLVVLSLLFVGAAAATVVPVTILEYTFAPDTVTVVTGDSVVWTNAGAFPHTSTSGAGGVPDGIWNSGLLSSGASYGHKFTAIGDFPYYCSLHYPIHGMAGQVRVRDAGVEDSPSTLLGTAIDIRPNPFSERTVISYSLPAGRVAQVVVADASGRIVRRLSGTATSATWDGRNDAGQRVPAGVYFVRVEGQSFRAVARVMMID